jgi:hypothetical protein
MNAWQRAAFVFGLGFVLAACIGAFANLANLEHGATYVLSAAAIALVAGLGVPWAFGWSSPMLFKDRHRMHPDEATVVASKVHAAKTHAGGIEFVLVKRVEEHRVFRTPPLVLAAGRADRAGTALGENLKETLEVSHASRS